eukprot:459317-Rhodomonas_salina.1
MQSVGLTWTMRHRDFWSTTAELSLRSCGCGSMNSGSLQRERAHTHTTLDVRRLIQRVDAHRSSTSIMCNATTDEPVSARSTQMREGGAIQQLVDPRLTS